MGFWDYLNRFAQQYEYAALECNNQSNETLQTFRVINSPTSLALYWFQKNGKKVWFFGLGCFPPSLDY